MSIWSAPHIVAEMDAVTPCFYADVALVEDRGENIRVVFYQDGLGPAEPGKPTACITLTRPAFYRSLFAAIARMLPDLGGRLRPHLDS